MNIKIHIEKLVLDGLPITRAHGPAVQQAVEAELTRLLSNGGLSSELSNGGAMPDIRARGIQLKRGSDSTTIGHQIAHSVYGGIGK